MDVVEEKQDLSKDKIVSFTHVKRSANSGVDLLAKEGVSHSNLLVSVYGLSELVDVGEFGAAFGSFLTNKSFVTLRARLVNVEESSI